MIVQPNFLDHWKTNALGAAIGRLEALTALLSLWAHCQNQRTWQFPNNEMMISGICRYTGNPRVLVDALLALNLLEKVDETTLEVHEWAETNAKLLHNWDAGKKGGRPPKQPKAKPTENPMVNPSETQGQTLGEPIREDKIRESTPIVPKGTNAIAALELSDPDSPSQSHQAEGALSAKKKRGVLQTEASAIYAAYPRKIGKDAALRAITRRLEQGTPAAELLAAAEAFARATAAWPSDDRQFIPHPATWFNRGSFADDPREWRRAGLEKKENGGADFADRCIDTAQHAATAVASAPADLSRAMDALYGDDWQTWAPGWYQMPPGDRVAVTQWLAENPEPLPA
jgi:hypothetical protein